MTSPKLRFQSSKIDREFWYDLVANTVFLRGLDAAMLQLNHELTDTDEPQAAAARFHKLRGARELRRVIVDLATVAKERVGPPSDNLV